MASNQEAVKPGYKQTEIGVIPEDWEVRPLEFYCSYISYGFTNPMPTVNEGVFMVTAADINNGSIKYGSARKTSIEAYTKLLTKKSKPVKGDLLLTKDGTLGRLAVVGNQKICINQSVALLRPNKYIDPNFLKFLLESSRYQKQMLDDAGGSTIKHIYITIVNKMLIGLPSSVKEQTAIAEALSDTDARITTLNALIHKKEQIKQGAMQQLLTGKVRLQGFGEGVGVKQTELGEIPEDWVTLKLGKLGAFSKGSGVKKDQSLSGKLPCIRYGEIYTQHHDYIKNFSSFISELVAQSATSIIKNDILFACSGETKEEIGKCVSFNEDIEAYAGGDIIILRPRNDSVSSLFLGYYLNTPDISKQKSAMGQGDAVVHINAKNLADINIVMPTLKEEQDAIAHTLTSIDESIQTLKQRLAKTKALKQGMMQELLTGKTRLVTYAALAEESTSE